MAHFFALAGINHATGPGGFRCVRLLSRDTKFLGSMGWYSGQDGQEAQPRDIPSRHSGSQGVPLACASRAG